MLKNIKYQKLKTAKFSGAGIGTNVFKVGIKNIGENREIKNPKVKYSKKFKYLYWKFFGH